MAKNSETAEVSNVAKDDSKSSASIKKFKKPGFRKLAILIILVIILLVGSAVIIVWLGHKSTKPAVKTPTSQSVKELQPVTGSAVTDTAYNLAANGKYSEAQGALDQALAKASNSATKADILRTKALVAGNNDHPTDAVSFAKQADALLGSSSSAYLIYLEYSRQGDTVDAKTYLQLAISRLDKTAKDYSTNLEDYQQKLQELGS